MTLSLRNERPGTRTCADAGCTNPVPQRATGRPADYCSSVCRSRAHRSRHRHSEPAYAAVQLGSTSAKGRTNGQVWTVWLHRGSQSMIVTIGLSRGYADDLAEAMTNMIQSSD
jgi:hypothetical protein